MFDKYVQITKEKDFYKSFILLIVISCVALSYNFQYILMRDDLTAFNGIFGYNATDRISDRLGKDPRFLGMLLSLFISDGSTSKNALLFLSLVGAAWSAVFYIRQGFAVKSKFWTVLLSSVLVLNAAMNEHYNFVINVIRLIPAFFGLALFTATIIENDKKSIILSSILLFLCISVYQPIAQEYIIGVIALVIVNILKKQDLSLKELFFDQLKNKIIPSFVALVAGVVLHLSLSELFLTTHKNQMYGALKSHEPFSNLFHNLREFLDVVIYQIYVGSLHNDRLVFLFLLFMAFVSIVVKLRPQKISKQMALSAIIMFLFFISPFIISFMELYNGELRVSRRLFVPYPILITLCLYLIYNALNHVKILKYLVPTLSFVFALQIINSTVTYAYRMVQINIARHATVNRLIVDIHNFAHEHGINGKPVVYFLYGGASYLDILYSKHKYLYYADWSGMETNEYVFTPNMIFALGGASDLFVYHNFKKTKKVCRKIVSTMPRWPFKNSMQLIDGVIYIKLGPYRNSRFVCDRRITYYSHNSSFVIKYDGYYNFRKTF